MELFGNSLGSSTFTVNKKIRPAIKSQVKNVDNFKEQYNSIKRLFYETDVS